MSTGYCFFAEIRIEELLDGRLERFGIREHINDETSDNRKCLTDGRNFFWINVDDEGLVRGGTRYAGNSARGIVEDIAEAFQTEFASEHNPRYWGYDTEEEGEAAQLAIAKKHDDEFYVSLLKFVAGEPNQIVPGTIGEIMAQIAKQLISADPQLAFSDKRDELMETVDTNYYRDYESAEQGPELEAFFKLVTRKRDLSPA
jgi:hypothetical protein